MAVLIAMSGPLKGHKFEFAGEELTLGRLPGNTIRLEDSSVSGHHAVIRAQENRYTLFDLNSTNGTRLNGYMIEQGRLKPKDIIQVGSIELLIDGADIEVDVEPQEAGPELDVTAGVSDRPLDVADNSTAFVPRIDTRWHWTVAFGGMAALVLAAAVFFLVRLFQAG